ncbi:MAG: bifunctional 5,10-methylene-tetrahydrofolate dehydrogenase/5,10-methylene-tetrahydrofolate cyclohydrolase [Candidatus Marinimicrobia bacterium]|nr:bifunctional 5,10-methylene-tetrahydrofolate dehydrogenase/5,10-methylene-tetrahydrofolate cyclohydrolase [Candidatus Neomarinimicrobiota bacterium]
MSVKILSGHPVAEKHKQLIGKRIDLLKKENIVPTLAAILVGDDPASKIYVNTKHKIFTKHNCKSIVYEKNSVITESDLISFIDSLNLDSNIHGILVQLPLPKHLDEKKILSSIDPNKDVDGFHPINVGKILIGTPNFIPCTPYGCLEILKFYKINVRSKHVVILGRSNIVGKPLMALLSQKFEVGNATVTICHTGTPDLKLYTRIADIIIVAIGIPLFLKSNMVKNGVDIIDVGINRLKDDSKKGYRIVGDVDYEDIIGKVNSITPVPGGVGPMTITMLLSNTVLAAERKLLKET